MWKGTYRHGQLINYVSERTCNYIVKYVTKVDEQHKTYKSRILTSPGIGRRYTDRGDYKNNRFNGKRTDEGYRTRAGFKVALPIYWRNKIYSEQEREQLWINRLDKQERWVLGMRIDIRKSEDGYYNALKWAREKNRRLGFGDDSDTWELEQYERSRRLLKQKERIERAQGRELERLPREV